MNPALLNLLVLVDQYWKSWLSCCNLLNVVSRSPVLRFFGARGVSVCGDRWGVFGCLAFGC